MVRVILALLLLAGPAAAALRVDPARSFATVEDGSAEVELHLSRPVPWSVDVEADPPRLAVALGDGAVEGWSPDDALGGWRRVGPDRTRLALDLPAAMEVERAWMETDGDGAVVRVALRATGEAATEAALTGPRPLRVALDPGHGGPDPGAEQGGTVEADLMLSFARLLAERLRSNGHEVVLTRDADVFVSLRDRASAARAAGADVLVSLHADAVTGGGASGATAYTLDGIGGSALTAELLARQARGDRIAGVEADGDDVAGVLIDMARARTEPRSRALAAALTGAIREAGLALHPRPLQGARFTVLKAPDIPSVLLELGFMSDPRDLANLRDPAWRARMADAVAAAVGTWARADAAMPAR